MVSFYKMPTSLDEALTILREGSGKAKIVAGGTDLFLEIKERSGPSIETLVDITKIPSLTTISCEGDLLKVGAAVTHTQLLASPLLREGAEALWESASFIGSPQVRNIGTLGGNIVNAAPAADTAVSLTALDAKALLYSSRGESSSLSIPLLYKDVQESRVDSTREMILQLEMKREGMNEASSFQRFSLRRSLSLPVVNVAVSLGLHKGHIERIRIVGAPAGPSPLRLYQTEEMALGRQVEPPLLDSLQRESSKEIRIRSSLLRGSSSYRERLVGVLVKRGLLEAFTRIRKKERKSSLS